MIESHIVQRRTGGKTGNMATKITRTFFICSQYHRQRIPTHQRADTSFHEKVTGHRRFFFRWDSVAIRGIQGIRERHPVPRGPFGDTFN